MKTLEPCDWTRSFRTKTLLAGVYTVDDSTAHTPSVNPLSLVDVILQNQVASLSESSYLLSQSREQANAGIFARRFVLFTGVTPVNIPGFVQGKPIGTVSIGGSTAINSSSQISTAGTNGNSNLRSVSQSFPLTDQVGSRGESTLLTSVSGCSSFRATITLPNSVWSGRLYESTELLAGHHCHVHRDSFADGALVSTIGRRLLCRGHDQGAAEPGTAIGFRGEFTNGWNESHNRSSNWLFDSNGNHSNNPLVGESPYTEKIAQISPCAASRPGLFSFFKEDRLPRRLRNLLFAERFHQLSI